MLSRPTRANGEATSRDHRKRQLIVAFISYHPVLPLVILLVLVLVASAGFGSYRMHLSNHRQASKTPAPHLTTATAPQSTTTKSNALPPSPTPTPPAATTAPPSHPAVVTVSPAPVPPNNPAPHVPHIDPSTPAAIGIPGSTCTQPVQSVSTPAFSPPANARIYIVAAADSYPIGDANCLNETAQNSIAAITSTAGTTWSRVAYTTQRDSSVGGFVDVWSTVVPASQSNMTITVNFVAPMKAEPTQVSPSGMLHVIVVDGAGSSQTVTPTTEDQLGSMTSTVAATVNGVPANALVFMAVDYWNSYSTPPAVPAGQAVIGNINNQGENDTWTVSDATAPSAAGPAMLSQTITDTTDTTDNWHAVAWAVTP